MTSASMTFGRPARLKAPRGALWFGSAAAALLNALRSADRWLLERARPAFEKAPGAAWGPLEAPILDVFAYADFLAARRATAEP